jgi:hypothetical protein
MMQSTETGPRVAVAHIREARLLLNMMEGVIDSASMLWSESNWL